MKLLAFRFLYLIELVAAATLTAEKLPIRVYTTADGLPHNTVMRVVRDSSGFLWFCTLRGLARFDGYTFQSYGLEQGLRGIVTDLLETHAQEYWVATLSGLYRFHPAQSRRDQKQASTANTGSAAQPMFELYRLSSGGTVQGVNTLHEDRRGTIWAATNVGLYQLVPRDGRWTAHLIDLAVPGKTANTIRVLELLEDRDGAMWVSLPRAGLRRLRPDGRIDSYTTTGLPAGPSTTSSFEGIVTTMLEDRERRVWIGSDRGLSLLLRRSGTTQLDWVGTYTSKDGLPHDHVSGLLEAADGNLWIGTSAGLSQYCASSSCGKKSFRSYVTAPLG